MEPLRTPLPLHRGVTVVEMLVVLGIIGILSIIVIVSQRDFNRSILVNYTAYDVALTIRSAETFGLASRVTGQVGPQAGYGVHFTTANPSTFVMFADTRPSVASDTGCRGGTGTPISNSPDAVSGDCVYTAGSDELINTYNLGNNMRLATGGLCTYSGTWTCSDTSLSIVFARPNTKVYFSRNGSYNAAITKARVIIASSQTGNQRGYICIDQSGSIKVVPSATVSSSACP